MPSSFQRLTAQSISSRYFLLVLMSLLIFAVSGCSATPQQDAAESSTSETATSQTTTETPFEGVDPLSPAQALPPVMLTIPTAQLETAVEPMGWAVADVEGERTTKWIVPESAAGWHVNSVGVGASGNLLISGHQVQGDAVFAPLSLGDVVTGHEILVEDEEGVVFVYKIVDVSEPIPASRATEAEMAQAMDYLAQTDEALLTLITGWPDFTTTHRIFAQAELLGVQ
jgi:hypothetical protein